MKQTTFIDKKKSEAEKKLLKQTQEMYGLLSDITGKKKFRRVHKIAEKFRQRNHSIKMGQKVKATDLHGSRKENQSDYIRETLATKHQELCESIYHLRWACEDVLRKFDRDRK